MELKQHYTFLSLRGIVVCSVGIIISIMLGMNAIVWIRDFKRNYLEAVEWRSEALAQGIINQITNNQKYDSTYYVNNSALLEVFSLQCLQLYELNQAKHVTHIAVIDATGRIAAHNDKRLWRASITSPALRGHLEQHALVTFLDGSMYHTLVPFFTPQNEYLGSIDIGFPEQIVQNKMWQTLRHAGGFLGLAFIIVIGLLFVLMHYIVNRPIQQLVNIGDKLAQGSSVQDIIMETNGKEMSLLGTVYDSIALYLQELADIAGRIALGRMDCDARIRSDEDKLGRSVHAMLNYLNEIADDAAKIAEGNLSETIRLRSEDDLFGRTIQRMVEGLRALILRIRDSSKRIAATGANISTLATQDMTIVKTVNMAAERVLSTMRELDASVAEVVENMGNLSSNMDQTSNAMSEMSLSIGNIAINTTTLKERSQQTTHSLNEAITVLTNVVESATSSKTLSQETIQNAREGEQSVGDIIVGMENLRQTITTAVNAMGDFTNRSHDIIGIVDVIRDIADRTSLLALNASIIAAQAGTHGRGFAVVADEIKNLAGGVAASTRDIATLLNSLQQDTQRVVQTIHAGEANVEQCMKRTQNAQGVLRHILDSAQRSSDLVTRIADLIHELERTTQRVVSDMQDVDAMADDITSSTTQQHATTAQINGAIASINEMVSQIKHAAMEQSKGIAEAVTATGEVTKLMAQNLTSSQRIAETTKELLSQADLLLGSVDQFKLRE